MSGIEIVSLVLGVLGILEPIEHKVQAIKGVTKSTTSIQKIIRRTRLRCLVQRNIFKNDARRLFGSFLTEAELEDMFGVHGANNMKWRDSHWETQSKNHLGNYSDGIKAAIKLIYDELDDIWKTTEKLKIFDSQSISEDISMMSPATTRSKSMSLSQKAHVAERKDKLLIQQKNLAEHVDAHRVLVNQFLEDRKKLAKQSVTGHSRPVGPPTRANHISWKVVQPVITAVNSLSKQFYNALQQTGGNCNCHKLHLRLDFDIKKFLDSNGSIVVAPGDGFSILYNKISFDVVAAGSASNVQGFAGINIRSNRDILRLEVAVKQIAKPCGLSLMSPTDSRSNQLTFRKKLQKQVGFALQPAGSPSKSPSLLSLGKKRKPVTENGPAIRERGQGDGELVQYSESPEQVHQISNLCSCLANILTISGASFGTQNKTPGNCLGYVSDSEQLQYVIYNQKSPPIISSSAPLPLASSLSDVIRDQGVDFTVSERLDLAYTLSTSVLRFHSSPWMRKNWKVKDVFLFQQDILLDSAASHRWSPYVIAAFDDMQRLQDMDGLMVSAPGEFRLSYIVSLGIILQELGSFKSKGEASSPSKTDYQLWSDTCVEVDRATASGNMGWRYQRVIETCIQWRFNNDPSNENVQREFYQKVVLQLKHCIDIFHGVDDEIPALELAG